MGGKFSFTGLKISEIKTAFLQKILFIEIMKGISSKIFKMNEEQIMSVLMIDCNILHNEQEVSFATKQIEDQRV